MGRFGGWYPYLPLPLLEFCKLAANCGTPQLTISMLINKKKPTNADGREGVVRFTDLPLWTGWVGREAISLLFFPLLLQLSFVFPGTAVGTQGFVDCIYCVGGACCIILFSSVGDVHLFCCTIQAFKKCPSTSQDDWEQHHIIPFCD
jgi:hypothetical protein